MQNLSSKPRVLIVEDDAALNEIVCAYLGGRGYECESAFSGSEALRALESDRDDFALAIVDLILPGLSGEELIGRIRAKGLGAPIIVTSAKASVADRVDVLRLGANDYLVKPFDLEELLARVEVQLRGRTASASSSAMLRYVDWELDSERRTLSVAGTTLHLTRTEFEIARALMQEPGRVLTKRQLFECVRSEESFSEADERAIVTHVGNLRAKLRVAAPGADALIETVWGVGFRLREK